MKTLDLRYPSPDALAEDLEKNLRKGRAYLAGTRDVVAREVCELVLVHPTSGEELHLRAEAVWVDANGVGFALLDLDDAKKEELAAFGAAEGEPGKPLRNVHDRIRQLSVQERDQVARHGPITDRVALERAFGSSVWEGLLQNPTITPAEIARIAKMGTLPKPLVNVIVNHAAWIAVPEVQRALLSNSRCGGPDLERVLRAMKPSELARVAQQSSYRGEVRSAAQRLIAK